MNRFERWQLTAVGTGLVLELVACTRRDQAPVHAPVFDVGSVAIVGPTPFPAEVVPPNQGGESSKPAVLDQFERWARSNIRFAFSSRPHRSDACFDSSGLEVSCSNPNAVRQETKVWDEIAGTVVNRSDATLTCKTTESTTSTAVLPPKGTHTFSIHTMPRAVDAEREVVSVRCTMLVGEAVEIGALPANTSVRTVGVEVSYGKGSKTIFLGKTTITSKSEDGTDS